MAALTGKLKGSPIRYFLILQVVRLGLNELEEALRFSCIEAPFPSY